jgi:hypothetical protein
VGEAGGELITMLTARKLLIPGTATTAKKAPLPDPLYVYCTKMLFAPEGGDGISDPSIPQVRPDRSKKARRTLRKRRSSLFSQSVIIENGGSVRNLVSRRPLEGVSHSICVSRTGSVINSEQFFLTPRVKSPFAIVLFLAAR